MWRTCSFILGYILETAFKANNNIELCSFSPPQFQYGSFAYDAHLSYEQDLLFHCIIVKPFDLIPLTAHVFNLEISLHFQFNKKQSLTKQREFNPYQI